MYTFAVYTTTVTTFEIFMGWPISVMSKLIFNSILNIKNVNKFLNSKYYYAQSTHNLVTACEAMKFTRILQYIFVDF